MDEFFCVEEGRGEAFATRLKAIVKTTIETRSDRQQMHACWLIWAAFLQHNHRKKRRNKTTSPDR